MVEIKVQTRVQMALESGNRVDANEAKLILEKILENGVSDAEYLDAGELAANAASNARAMGWAGLGVLKRAGQLRAEGKGDEADRMLDRASAAMKDSADFRDFAMQLFLDIDAAHKEQHAVKEVPGFFSRVWDSIWN